MKRLALLAALSALAAGCTVPVVVTTKPPGALIIVNGERQGVSPLTIEAPHPDYDRTLRIEACLDGYKPAMRGIEAEPEDANPGNVTATIVSGLLSVATLGGVPVRGWSYRWPAQVDIDMERTDWLPAEAFADDAEPYAPPRAWSPPPAEGAPTGNPLVDAWGKR